MAYIGHKPGINLQLTVAENLALWHAMYACSEESKQQTAEHLKQFKLNACLHIFAGNLSAGQQKRLAWVRLLAQHRTIWLLDESFTHLDTHALQIAIQHIKAHAEQGGSVLFTSHQDLSDQIKSDQMLTLEGNHD